MYPLCSTSPKYNQAVNKQKLFCHVKIHLVSSNVLTGQILSIENLFMSKALAKIKRLRSKPIFICDICCPRVGNDRRRCLLDESLFLFFFFSFFFFIMIEGEIGERGSPKQMAISDWPIQGLTIDLLRRELYDSREGDWDFFTEKNKKICNLEPRVISAPLKMSRNDPGLEIEKKKQFQEALLTK